MVLEFLENPVIQLIITIVSLGAIVITYYTFFRRKKSKELPLLTIVNFGVEPPEITGNNITKYHPNLRNDGNIAVRNVRINFKFMCRVVSLKEIIDRKEEIKKREIRYEGTITPTQSARVDAIDLEKSAEERSLVLWLEYNYDKNKSDQSIFNIRFKNWKKVNGTFHNSDEIKEAEKELKDFKSGKIGF